MKQVLQQLRQVTAKPAVSLFVKTHRTHPENEQDSIALKNGLKQVQDRVSEEFDKRTADAIIEQITQKTDALDHNYNLESLAIFATKDDATVLRLPFETKSRVIVEEKFATRDFTRDLSESVHYYILALTSDNARLIEAVNDRLIKEIQGDSSRQEQTTELSFPIKNTSLPTGSKADRTGSSDDDAYLKEFLNRVDKSMQAFYNIDSLPVILAGDERILGFFEQVCDNTSIIAGKVDHIANLKDGRAEDIVAAVQGVVDEKRAIRYEQALADLQKAQNDNLLYTDLQAVYRASVEGNVSKLLVKQGYVASAKINDNYTLSLSDDVSAEGVIDDIVSEIIDIADQNGAEVVFVPAEKIKEDIALIARY